MKELPTVRERTEELERASLSTWATLATESKGRDRHEEPDPLRTTFHVDRDRILGTPAFRRLKETAHSSPTIAESSSSLVHTLHVVSVARTIGRALRLNEDLVEAIALAHDLGIPPFGQTGEDALSTFTQTPFRHGEQSLRVVEHLADGGRGLNLTWEVRDGIVHHDDPDRMPMTLEGQVVRIAARIASLVYDLDDAVSAGVLTRSDLPADVTSVLGTAPGEQIARAAADVVAQSLDRPDVTAGARVEDGLTSLASFLRDRVHRRPSESAERDRALHCLRSIAVFYLEAPALLPGPATDEDPVVRVCDFLCSLSDSDALDEFRRRFVPTSS